MEGAFYCAFDTFGLGVVGGWVGLTDNSSKDNNPAVIFLPWDKALWLVLSLTLPPAGMIPFLEILPTRTIVRHIFTHSSHLFINMKNLVLITVPTPWGRMEAG